MKDIIKNISIGNNLVEKIEKKLYIKYDNDWNEADFFYYIFTNKLEDGNFYEKLSEELWQEEIKLIVDNNWENISLKTIDSFDKKLNLIIFYKLDEEKKVTPELNKKVYEIEKNPYRAAKHFR